MVKIRNNDLEAKSIDIDISSGVSVHLSKDEYISLCNLLCTDLKDEFNLSIKRMEKSVKTSKECWELINDIRNIFYEIENGSDYAIRKGLDEIDKEQLFDIIDKHSKLLGFE